jgi:hypothetical protein
MFAVASIVQNYRASVANTPRKRNRLSPENVAKGPLAAAAAKRATARAAHADIIGPITELRGHGLTFAAIADALNTEGRLGLAIAGGQKPTAFGVRQFMTPDPARASPRRIGRVTR